MFVGVVSCVSNETEKDEMITDLSRAMEFLEKENLESQKVYSRAVLAAWNYNTNITEENFDRMVGIIESSFP